jgi:ribosomal protein S12 methylthiotransferase
MEILLDEIRSRIPGICLRATFITGFPGETRADIDDLKDFLEKQRFDRVGVFTYSHEDGTSAFGLKDDLSQDEKESRAREVMEVQQDISFQKNQEKVGHTFKVMVDRRESGRFLGRTEFDSVEVDNEVVITGEKDLEPGEFINVRITRAYDYDLEGVKVD